MHNIISEEKQRQRNRDRALEALNSLSVQVITPEKGLDEWGMIEGLVADYARVHREELRVFLHGVKMVRQAQRNSTASNTVRGVEKMRMRHALCMPQDLMVLLKRFVPDLFTNKNKMRKFMKRFPGFCIPENI